MRSDIELAEPFHYDPGYMVVAGVGLVMALLALLGMYVARKVRQRPRAPKVKKIAPLDLAAIKRKYLRQLDVLMTEAGQKEMRKTYQALSRLMRGFVYEVTGVKVTKYTLQEIDRMKFPELYEIVEDCYMPEFSREGEGDLTQAIAKIKMGIEKWK